MIESHSCDTGFRSVSVLRPESPISVIQMWVQCGSLFETKGLEGAAHAVEHMVFKGSEGFEAGKIIRLIESWGGDANAYTSYDHTVYYFAVPSERVYDATGMLFSMVFSGTFPRDEWDLERQVIINEIQSYEDEPQSLVGYKLYEKLYNGTEAGRPIIGSTDGIKQITRDQLFEFYKAHYALSRAALVVSGSFDPARLEEVVAEKKASIAKSSLAMSAQDVFPSIDPAPANGPSIEIIRAPQVQSRLTLAFRSPSALCQRAAIHDVAAFALTGGDSSRLLQRIRDVGDAVAISASAFSPYCDVGVFEVSALVGNVRSPELLRKILAEINKLQNDEPISSHELQRIVAHIEMGRLREQETVEGLASRAGFGVLTPHGPSLSEAFEEHLGRLTADEVLECIREEFNFRDAVVVYLTTPDDPITEQDFLDVLKSYEDRGTSQPASLPISRSNGKASMLSALQCEKPRHIQIHKNLRLIFNQRPGELTSVCFATEGGLRFETPDQHGWFHCAASMIGNELPDMSYDEISRALDDRAAYIEGFSGKDSLGATFQCLNRDFQELSPLLIDCLVQSKWSDAQWTTYGQEVNAMLAAEQESPKAFLLRRVIESVYGDFPYGRREYGELKVDRSQIEDFNHAWVRGGPWIVSVTSSLDESQIADFAEKFSNHLSSEQKKRSAVGKESSTGAFETKKYQYKSQQAHCAILCRSVNWQSHDLLKWELMAFLMGGHSGILFEEIREKSGLVYDVSPIASFGCAPGVFGVYFSSDAKDVDKVRALRDRCFQDLPGALEPEHLERAKAGFITEKWRELEASDGATQSSALMNLYTSSVADIDDYRRQLAEISTDDVKDLIQHVSESWITEVTVGP